MERVFDFHLCYKKEEFSASLSPPKLLRGEIRPGKSLPFHSGESRNLCGDSRIRRQATIPLRGKFSLARE